MASTIRITSALSGTLEGTTHTLSGTRTLVVNGMNAETFDVTTTYADCNYSNGKKYTRVLISNEGSDEIKVRIERTAATLWEYFNIPAGKAMEFLNSSTTVGSSNLQQISVKAMNTSSRVTVLQAWN